MAGEIGIKANSGSVEVEVEAELGGVLFFLPCLCPLSDSQKLTTEILWIQHNFNKTISL